MEPFLTLIGSRRSVRQFSDAAVDDFELAALVDAANAAPSAADTRPWSFLVARDRSRLRAAAGLHKHYRPLENAAALLLVCAEPSRSYMEFWPVDCAAATENALLAAHALGLGAVWLGVHPVPELVGLVRGLFGLPDGIVPVAMVALGRPVPEPAGRERPAKERPELWFESWGGGSEPAPL